ncbi:MAG: ABC transporter permease [Methylohalobius crimeensis]
MKDWILAGRLLRRDWRAGELRILSLALIIAVVSVTAIALVADRLTRTMIDQAADFLAADMVVRGHAPLPKEWLAQAQARQLNAARTLEFTSVLVENDQLLLVGVKAVSDGYPLRGYLKTTRTDIVAETMTRSPPKPGHVWVAQRVLDRLGLKRGDYLHVGKQRLLIDRILTFEPDTRTSFYSLAPRVMMRVEDLAAAAILGPGSRAHYYQLFSGSASDLKGFKGWLKPRLAPNQRLLDIHEDRPDVGRALNRAERYLGLASVIVVLIAGVAVAMAARRYTERHFDATAVMKCLGARQNTLLRLYAYQFLCLGIAAGGIGTLIGWVVQESLVFFLREMLPERLAWPSVYAFGFGPLTALLLLWGFSLPPLLRLRRVPPAMALRRDLLPAPASVWLVYGLGGAAIVLLLWRFTRDAELTGLILGGGAVGLLVLAGVVALLLELARFGVRRLGLSWRLGLQNLTRHRRATVGQTLAFCVTLAAMSVSFLVRNDLVDAWQDQLPADAPNHFVINVFPEELPDFRTFLKDELQAQTSQFYPIVRGRLVEVNGTDVHLLAREDSEGDMAINRDLSLTWAEQLPADNRLVGGSWWQPDETGRSVSVERDLAESLGIRVGDRLTFLLEGRRIDARVASLRTVQWDSMSPNFYMIFAPGDLAGFTATYMTSFYLPTERKPELAALIRRFPHVTLVEVDMILRHFRMILRQVTFAVEYVLVFALLAGLTVLLAAVRSSIDERIYQGALMRALGARRQLLRRSQWVEFLCLGGMAGWLAVWLTETIAWILYVRIFDIPFQWHAWIWLVVPAIGAVLTGLAGYWGTREVLRKSPVAVFRDL